MKHLLLVVSIAFMFSCADQKKDKKETVETKTETVEKSYGIQNYAVVWYWKTEDKKLVEDNALAVTNELQDLFNKGIVENIYFDAKPKINKLEYFPNITFFLKANNLDEAKKTLDAFVVVKKNIATYAIHPVGLKWLGRNDKAQKLGLKSFVTVWKTKSDKDLIEKTAQEQTDAMVALWDKGSVENIYADFGEGNNQNEKRDFVIFVNAENEEEAKAICDGLPFSKNGLSSYIIQSVGHFWMGDNKK